MFEYEPGRFSGDADTPFGRSVWKLLNQHKVIHAMEVASDLGQPAVAGIEEALLEAFGKEVLEDRAKQLIGHMVRQIMERHGFVVEQSNVKMNSVPFSKGTRYRRPDWHHIHVFRCTSDIRELCLTGSRQGEKLPRAPGGGKWRYWSSFATKLRGAVAFGIKPSEAHKEIKAYGYFRVRQKRRLRAG